MYILVDYDDRPGFIGDIKEYCRNKNLFWKMFWGYDGEKSGGGGSYFHLPKRTYFKLLKNWKDSNVEKRY